MFKQLIAASLPFLLLATGCDDDSDITDLISTPDEVVIDNQPGLYPEGVDYSTELDRFLVSSVASGNVGTVDDDGEYTVLVDDDRIISSLGILVDDERDRVLVTMSDNGGAGSTPDTYRKIAQLGSFSTSDGSAAWVADLAALNESNDTTNLANDIAIDDAGNAYVTNSFSPIIYKVTPAGEPSIFLRNERFRPAEGAFGFNGIVATDNYLVVGYPADSNALYRISLTDTSDIIKVGLSAPLPNSPDGLELIEDDELAVVCNGDAVVLKLETDNEFETTAEDERFPATNGEFPTTVAERGGEAFVLYSFLNRISAGDTTQARYPIQKFKF